MAPSVKLHFFAANDINGDLLHEVTDEDDYFKSLKLKVERDGLGGAELLLARTVGFAPFASGTFRAESFVRLIIPAYSSTTYYPWGFFLNKRQQVVVHVDEKGGEEFKLGGPGPKQYLARHALGIETQTSQAPTVDLENGVWRWNEHATVGRILNKVLDEDAALNNPSLPDLTWTFDNIDDSDSVNWADDDIAGPGDFEVPIGTDFLKILWDLDDFVQLTSWVDLGTVASPKFELNVIQGLGDDNTGSAFGAGVCLLKEGENIADDAVTVEGASLRQASHVLVEGKDGVWVQAVRTGYSPGDYTKREKISFTRTSNEAWLEAVGKRWLDRQDNGEKEITIEIVPGQSDNTGLYFPAPDRVLWLSNQISVETAADGTNQTALDLDPSDAQLVTGFELDTHQAADDSDSTAYARSWDVKVKLNVERSGNVQKTPDQRSTASAGGCRCPALCHDDLLIESSTDWKAEATVPADANWHTPAFDDSAYANAVQVGGLAGSEAWVGAPTRWIWATTAAEDDASLRGTFTLSAIPGACTLEWGADGAGDIYLNGTLLDTVTSLDVSWVNHRVIAVDPSLLIVGDNVLSAEALDIDVSGQIDGFFAVLSAGSLPGSSSQAARCDHNHLIEGLSTLETDTDLRLAPDGSGGVSWETTAGGSLPWFVVTDYGATGDGSTDDQSSINSAIAALNTAGGGVLYFPATPDAYLTSGALTSITAPCIVKGDGLRSRITCSSATANLFTSAAHEVHYQDLYLDNSHATPTAGAAIRVTSGNLARYSNVVITDFWIGIDHEDGIGWTMDHLYIESVRKYGIQIAHATPDFGDWAIDNSVISDANGRSADAAIRIESSGGGKITNLKVNGDPANGYNHGIDLNIANGIQTIILLVQNCSIENIRGDGIHAVSAGTGRWPLMVIAGNQFALNSNNAGKAISLVANSIGEFGDAVISNNLFATDGTARSAVQLTNVDNLTFAGNVLIDNFTSLYTNTTSTNITELGAGGGAPTNADYLVGTANGSLSAEIVVGTSPGGELGGTWASPTVDATHAGGTHLTLGTTPSTQAFGDAAAGGSATTASKNDHKHAMPAAAVTTSGLTQATNRLLGRTTAATGAIEEITVGSGLSFTGGALAVAGGVPAGFVTCRKTADETFNSTSYANSTNMGLAVAASKFYFFRFVIYFTTNATTVGIKLGLTGPSGTGCYAGAMVPVAAPNASTGNAMFNVFAASGDISANLAVAEATNGPGANGGMAIIEGQINTGGSSGTLQLRHASETATNTTIKELSHGWLFEVT